MNIKQLKQIKDMSSRLSGIKARAAHRDEEIRKQQEEAERADKQTNCWNDLDLLVTIIKTHSNGAHEQRPVSLQYGSQTCES